MEIKVNSKNYYYNNSNIRFLIFYNFIYSIVKYLVEIVFYIMLVWWKILVTLSMFFRIYDFDDFDFFFYFFCVGGYEVVICKNREMMRLNRVVVWLEFSGRNLEGRIS